jgi:hypothetical protein
MAQSLFHRALYSKTSCLDRKSTLAMMQPQHLVIAGASAHDEDYGAQWSGKRAAKERPAGKL